MKSANKEIKDALNAILVLEEIFTFDGQLDTSIDDEDRKLRAEAAKEVLEKIAEEKGVTANELYKRVSNIAKQFFESQ